MAEFSPMMKHYLEIKEEYKDCIVFYRLGDFYEMFFEDAKTQTPYIIKDKYNKTEVKIEKNISIKRNSYKKSDTNNSNISRKIEFQRKDTKNKSHKKEEKKSKNKSSFKHSMLNSKKIIKNDISFSKVSNEKNIRNHLIFQKIELKINTQSISSKKISNRNIKTNWSFNDISFKNNINSKSFHNKSKSKKKESTKSKNKSNKSYKNKINHNNSKLSNLSKNKNESKRRIINYKDYNSYNYNSVEPKPKLFSVNNNNYSFNKNYSLYIIDNENDFDNSKSQGYSTEKDYIKIINNKTSNEYKIIENLLRLEPRNWYDELSYISNRINKIGEISKNFNEILEKYSLIYNQFDWIIYSLSYYLKNIFEEKHKILNYDVGLSDKFETWKKGFKWKNLFIRVIPLENSRILINEMKALNYFFFDYLQLLDTNSSMKKNNYIKNIPLSNKIIFPLIGYSKITNYILFTSALIKTENTKTTENSEIHMKIEEIIEQSNKLINYYTSSNETYNNISTAYKINNNNYINNQELVNKRNKIMLQININKYSDLDLESSLGENFYVKDLIQSKLFKEINNYNLIKIKQGKYIIFNLAKYIPNLFDIKFKKFQKFNFYSEFKEKQNYFTLFQNSNVNNNIPNSSYKYIKTPEDVIDKIFNMKNNFTSPLNYKEIYMNNIYFKIIYEKTENTKKDYKSKSFVDQLFRMDTLKSFNGDKEKNGYNNHRNNNSNLNDNSEENNYIKGKYVILYDLIEPIKLDYSLIKNIKVRNENYKINEFFFLKTNYFSHFYSWCEMLNKNNFNIKTFSDLKYFMKKYSINVNLLFFGLVYIKNNDISDIIKIHLLIKIIYQIYSRENINFNNSIPTKFLLYIKNILYPHELSFGNETKCFNNFYLELLFYTKVLFLKYKLIDDYMNLGLFNLKTEKPKNDNNKKTLKQIKELIPGFDSPKEFLKHIIFIARKKPFHFLSEFEIKFNIIINPYIKFKSSLSLESMEGYLSKNSISFNKIITYSYVKPKEISGLILAKLLNTYKFKDEKEINTTHETIENERINSETNNNLKVIYNCKINDNGNKAKNKKEPYKSKRMHTNHFNNNKNNENNQDLYSTEENLDEFSNDYYLKENTKKVPLSFVNLSSQKKKLISPIKESKKNEPRILFWKNICNKISISLSPICYKLILNYEQKNKNDFSNYLKYEYIITSSEILKNWNECSLNVFRKIRSCTGNAEFALLKTYIFLFIYFYFIKKNKEESKKILLDMKSIFNSEFYRISFNNLAIFNLFQGLCLDKDSEKYFAKSLILFLLTYGDPRGRNNDSHLIVQLPLWIISNEILKLNEIIIYEYFKEMFQALQYFESKRNDPKMDSSNKKVIDYLNNIKNNIGDLLSLNMTNKNNSTNEKTNITYNNISTLKNKNKLVDSEISQKIIPPNNIINFQKNSDYFISNEIFNKNHIDRGKIKNYLFPSINSKFSNKIDDFFDEDFAVYIFEQIQSIFLNSHKVLDNEYINNFIHNDIFNQDNVLNIHEASSSNDSTYFEPKMKEEVLNKTNNYKRKNKNENVKEDSFLGLLNKELLDKLSYKKNIPSGVIISFGNNTHNETSHEKYDILTFPRVVYKLKNEIIENIYSGWEHNVVVSKKGKIFTFGHNQSYQCGLPNTNIFHQNSIPDPTNISELYNIYSKEISCGNEHSLILTHEKKVYGIGNNEDGVLGYNDIAIKSYKPLLIHFGDKDEYTERINLISSGTVHNMALTDDGKVFSWGAAMGGQLGHDEKFLINNSSNKKNFHLSKPSIISSFTDKKILINKISCGEAHSIAITNSGEVYCWGFGSNGQLGLGFCEDSFEPGKGLVKSRRMLPEKMNISNIKEIQCGKTFTMLINKENRLLSCGNNDLCQLGFKSELTNDKKRCHDLIYPTILDSFSTFEVMKISCGEGHCLAIINDSSFTKIKSLWSWGSNKYGQIGQGSIVKIGLPAPINLLLDYSNDKNEFAEISCGGFHSLCLIKRKKNINWLFDDFDKKISKIIDDLNI